MSDVFTISVVDADKITDCNTLKKNMNIEDHVYDSKGHITHVELTSESADEMIFKVTMICDLAMWNKVQGHHLPDYLLCRELWTLNKSKGEISMIDEYPQIALTESDYRELYTEAGFI